jgi:hypothetical protein
VANGGGDVAGLGGMGGGRESRQAGPACQGEKREKVTSSEGANKKGKHISTGVPLSHGPDGPTREATACGGRVGRRGGLGRIPGMIQLRN